jgi:transcription elongation factor Elf1
VQELPKDWQCPVCGADRVTFQVQETEVAGFAANQGYGLGTNAMTEGQKSGLIYGSLITFFFLFLCGYFLQ